MSELETAGGSGTAGRRETARSPDRDGAGQVGRRSSSRAWARPGRTMSGDRSRNEQARGPSRRRAAAGYAARHERRRIPRLRRGRSDRYTVQGDNRGVFRLPCTAAIEGPSVERAHGRPYHGSEPRLMLLPRARSAPVWARPSSTRAGDRRGADALCLGRGVRRTGARGDGDVRGDRRSVISLTTRPLLPPNRNFDPQPTMVTDGARGSSAGLPGASPITMRGVIHRLSGAADGASFCPPSMD